MWTIFKIFIEFVTVLLFLCFGGLFFFFFLQQGVWIQPHPYTGSWNLNHRDHLGSLSECDILNQLLASLKRKLNSETETCLLHSLRPHWSWLVSQPWSHSRLGPGWTVVWLSAIPSTPPHPPVVPRPPRHLQLHSLGASCLSPHRT